MKYVPINPQERQSGRYHTLLLALQAHADREADLWVFAHLNLWYARWAADGDYEHGIFWDCDHVTMGRWAEWSEPLKFGRALARAGYVKELAAVFPAELLSGRSGLIATTSSAGGGTMLDLTWEYQRKRADAHALWIFLSSPARRRSLYLTGWRPPAGVTLPDNWLDAPDEPPASGPGRPQAGNMPEKIRPGAGFGGAPAPRSPVIVGDVKDVKEKTEIKERQLTSEQNQASGIAKSWKQFEFIRDVVSSEGDNDDALLAAMSKLDAGDRAVQLWQDALHFNRAGVVELLKSLTSSEDAWARLREPYKVLTSKCALLVAEARQRTRRAAGRSGGSGGQGKG